MSDFKLKSIDEFDSDFISSLETAVKEVPADPEPETDEQIPVIQEEPENSAVEEITPDFEVKVPSPAEAVAAQSIYTKPEPTVHFEEEPDYDEEVVEEKPGKSKGAIVGEIISIAMLVLTVAVFVAGCFISIFLDNNGQAIAGTTFNTVAVDIDTLGLSKGDMIIAKKAESSAYQKGNLIVAPYSEADGCNVLQITGILDLGNTRAFTLKEFTGTVDTVPSYDSETCYGLVSSYIPFIGGLLSFAMHNAALICALFVLLAAFWCLILVLIEKTEAKKRKTEN